MGAPQDEASRNPRPEERSVSKDKDSGFIAVIVAVAANGVIGAGGALPWRIPEDLKRFKALTMGKPVIMGRKTWDSLPKKPLPGRTNIVVTRNPDFQAEGARLAHDVGAALALARAERPGEIMVIGGEAIFRAALPLAHRLYLTEVEGMFAGDVFMPTFERGAWRETAREGPFESETGVRYSFVTLEQH